MSFCDVIIPTHGHRPALRLTLQALQEQFIPTPWQLRLILSFDGSTPPANLETTFPAPWLPTKIVTGPQQGAAAARNRALAQTTLTPPQNHIILFLGDDIILRPNALAAHLQFHQRHPDPHHGALGFIIWDPRLLPTPLMSWIVHGGPQNNFDDLLSGQPVSPSHFFYGSCVSLKKSILTNLTFPPYTHYGWEDLDLGRQLAARQLQLFPLLAARALHRHMYTPDDIIRRSHLTGRSLLQYQERYPTEPLIIPGPHTWWRTLIYRYTGCGALARVALRLLGPRLSLPRLFLLVTAAGEWSAILQKNGGKLKRK